MRRIRNLGLFAIVASLVAIALVVVLRPVVQRAMGVTVDIGSGGLAELVVPDGYEVSVFAEGPRVTAVHGRLGGRGAVRRGARRRPGRRPPRPRRGRPGRRDDRGRSRIRVRAFGGLRARRRAARRRRDHAVPAASRRRSSRGGTIRRAGGPDHRRPLHPDGRRAARRPTAPLGRVNLQRLCRERSAARRDQPRAARGRLEPGLHDRSSERGGRLGRSGDRTRLGDQHGPRLAGRRPAARDRLRGGRRRRCRLAEVPRRGPRRSGVRRRGRLRRASPTRQ